MCIPLFRGGAFLEYIRAESSHAETISVLASLLYGNDSYSELLEEFKKAVRNDNQAIFICINGQLDIGFAEFSLRHDYVEGTQFHPVGYVEAIFVREQYRNRGIARNLIRLGEQWAKEKGCRQMASDCELSNKSSLDFHLKCGFSEANRIICFLKDI
jgi:aminoglycoside 6'-N-acetyltransferase I